MKYLLVIPMLIACLQAQDMLTRQVEAPITEATVFRQRAMITRTHSLNLNPGTYSLVFTGLSPSLVANSLQVRGEGDGTILSAAVYQSYSQNTPATPRMRMVRDSIRDLSDTLAVLADQQDILEKEEALLLANDKLAGSDKGMNPDDLSRLADLFSRRMQKIRRAKRTIQYKKRDLEPVVNRLKNELADITAMRNKNTLQAGVALKVNRSGTFTLTLQYLVKDAGWNPAYDMRVASQQDPISGTLVAAITNNTGVDWKQVRLNLSTAANAGSNVVPELQPMYVRILPEYSRSRRDGAGNAMMPATSNTADRRVLTNTIDAELANPGVDVRENDLALEFGIELPYNIPADNQPHRVPVKQFELQGVYRHYAVPKKDRDVFLVAMIQEDLLRGPANVYYQGGFVGTTYVDTDDPTDTMRLTLGRDPGVQVAREPVAEYTARQSLGAKVRVTKGFEITLRNIKSVPVSLTLRDQIPVSTDKSIEVTVEDISGAEYSAGNGMLRWTLSLEPGETRTLLIRYEVKFPKNRRVSGL